MVNQREQWEKARRRRQLVPGEADFAQTGCMAHLDEPRLLVTVLPSDPLAQPLDFDDDALTGFVLPQRFTGRTANGISMLGYTTATSNALVRFAAGGAEQGWRGFVAIRRDCGVDVGLGSVVRFAGQRQGRPAPVRAYRLFMVVHCVRVAVEAQARLLQRLEDTKRAAEPLRPFEIDVALPGAGEWGLGGLADGWEEPESAFEPPVCLERDPLVRVEVDQWPQEKDEQTSLVSQVADRVCNAFGHLQPLYIARVGPGAGHISEDYA